MNDYMKKTDAQRLIHSWIAVFGGACFRKDIFNLAYFRGLLGLNVVTTYWQQVVDMNDYMKKTDAQRIIHSWIAVFGGSCFQKDIFNLA